MVEQSKTIPNSYIEYNGELPNIEGVTENEFFGVKAIPNSRVPKGVGCTVVFKY